jgi:hypothetical protein
MRSLDDDDDGLDDTTGDVAERERLALPLDDRPQHDGGADVVEEAPNVG